MANINSMAREKVAGDTAMIDRTALDPDIAISLFKRKLQGGLLKDNADSVFIALIGLSIKYTEKQEYEKSRDCSAASIPWARRSTQQDAVAWAYNNIADAYYYQGDYLLASEYLYKALNALEKPGHEATHTAANIYNNLGMINMRLGQAEKALGFFAEAEDICIRGKLYFQLGENYTEKGKYYVSIHKTDSAERYFIKVMDIGKQINKLDLQAIANCGLGKTEIEKGNYSQAIAYLQKSLLQARGIYDYIAIDALFALGDALYHQKSYKQAETVLISALQEAKRHNSRDHYIGAYTKLISVCISTGRYKDALIYNDTLTVIKDSLTNVAKATAYNQLEMKYRTAEKDKELAQNQLLIAQQQSKITKKNIWIGVVGGSIFLLIIVIISMSRNARHKERLQAEQIKSLQQQNKIGTLNAMVQGEENERGRIARELHDGVGGMLAAAMMRFGTMRHDNEGIDHNTAYREAMDMLDQVGDEIRKTAHNLMPEVLKKQNLAEAVRSFCNYMQEKDLLKIDFQSYGSFDNIPGDVKLHIYRIMQELLKNIKQHAQATTALVQLMMNEHTLAITVEDNGIGFQAEKTKNGIGLHNVETRVRSLGGTFTIESGAGKGTMVYIEFEMHDIQVN